jgi:apolipoprotein N-acyltransferase
VKAVSDRSGPQEKLLIFGAAAIGILSSIGENHPNLAGLWSLVPLLWLETKSRRSAFLTVFAFYLVFSRGILPGAAVFFRDGSLIRAFVLWVSSAAALTVPWGLLWNAQSPMRKALGVTFAVLASIPPPLGLIGWGNPLITAGLFFPGMGWFGLIFMLWLYIFAALSCRSRRVFIIAVLLSVPFLSVPASGEKTILGDVTILSVNTSFGRVASGSGDFDTQFERERMVFQHIREKERNGELEGADIVVLPETIIGRMNPTTMKRWEKFFEPFTQQKMVFIAGGEMPTDRGRKYNNVMVSFEGEGKNQTALQRFPVLFSMFVPFSSEGANAYLSSLGEISIMEIRGKRLGFLVCYEQFLTWPFLTLMSQGPDVIVAPSNLWWCKDTSLPGIQAATVQLWAALFGVPVVASVNR